MQPSADEDIVCNCLAIRQAARQITQIYDAELASTGLRATQYTVLARLSRLGPSTVQGLADALVMDRSTLGHNLQPLQRAGLVSAVADPNDRRVKRLDLTPRGRTILAAARAAWQRAQRKFHDRFGETESVELRRTLRRVVEALAPISS